jgi:myo-inositol-1(or 4)-monophosphatase
MDSMTYDGLQYVMRRIGNRVLKIQKGSLDIHEKNGHQDIVTVGDRTAEDALVRYVRRHFPGDGIRGEEGAFLESRSGFQWYFDPIDGTTNYSQGLPIFGISAGRADATGVPVFGAVRFPASGLFFLAQSGEGAFDGHGSRLSVDPDLKLRESVVLLGSRTGHEHFYGILRPLARNVLILGSFVWEASLVFTGHAAASVHTGATPFDVAAVTVIAREAGCSVSRIDGRPLDLREKKIPLVIAANRQILETILGEFRGWVL